MLMNLHLNFELYSLNLITKYKMTHVDLSLDTIQRAGHVYQFNELAIAFNGGKEATVIYDLVTKEFKKTPLLFCIKERQPFPELIAYRAGYPVVEIENLNDLSSRYPQIKAIFMGTRRTDPHGANLEAFQKTDPGWPEFMRINPILEWKYDQVWTYLLSEKVQICELYWRGYTSLGEEHNTQPNPRLKLENGYAPAWDLKDGNEERLGRT